MKLKCLMLILSLVLCLSSCSNRTVESKIESFENEVKQNQTESKRDTTEVIPSQGSMETTTNSSPTETKESKTVIEKQTDPNVDLLKKYAAFITENNGNIDGSCISPNGVLQKNDLCSVDLWDICGDPTPELVLTVYGENQLYNELKWEQQNKLFFP